MTRKLASAIIAALALTVPSPASARRGAQDEGADDDETPAKAQEPSKVGASLEFLVGFGSTFDIESDGGGTEEFEGQLTLGIVPGFDKLLGQNFAVGGEYMFVWGGVEDAADERSLIMSPHLRFRMMFPIVSGLSFDGLFGIGPTIWVGNDKVHKSENTLDGKSDDAAFTEPMRDTRMGWSLRFNFGAGWKFNDTVAQVLPPPVL